MNCERCNIRPALGILYCFKPKGEGLDWFLFLCHEDQQVAKDRWHDPDLLWWKAA